MSNLPNKCPKCGLPYCNPVGGRGACWEIDGNGCLERQLASALKERDELRKRREAFYQDACEWRGVELENACKDCGGSGVKTYSSTATWIGGIGGQAMTDAVCDKCWGSGNQHKPWANLRRIYAERDALKAKLASCQEAGAVEYRDGVIANLQDMIDAGIKREAELQAKLDAAARLAEQSREAADAILNDAREGEKG